MSMLDIVKQAAIEAVKATNPDYFLFGEVTKAKPLEIEVHERLTLSEDFLIVLEHLTRHERIVTIEHQEQTVRELGDKKGTDVIVNDGTTNPIKTYKHSYVKMIFEDGLNVGDKVVLARTSGGQKYIVFDRYYEGEKAWDYPKKQ